MTPGQRKRQASWEDYLADPLRRGDLQRRPRPSPAGRAADAVVIASSRLWNRALRHAMPVLLPVLLVMLYGAVATRTLVAMAGPSSPPAQICGSPVLTSPWNYDGAAGSYTSGTAGLPTFGSPSSDFPADTAGDVLAPGTASFLSFQLNPNTVYYLEPGVHTGQIQADAGDAFVGGNASGTASVLSGGYNTSFHYSIDSNSSNGNQAGVTIEYLTIEQFEPLEDQSTVNPDGNTGWTIKYDTITLNVPGAGIQATTTSDIEYDCLTANGQYGINAGQVNGFGVDSLTGGSYAITIAHDEISHNDTCDLEGLLTNTAAGYANYNPVPGGFQNSHCSDQGATFNDGNWGGFKLWRTNGVLVEDDWIHDNYGVGGWADTDNANTTWTGNLIQHNDYEGIQEEISYNFSITGNRIDQNDWIGGLGNPGFPQPAIYVSESGSDGVFGGIPACSEPACAGFPAYPSQSVISGNTITDNGGGVFLWENAGRYCSSGIDSVCDLAAGGAYTLSNCGSNFSSASVNMADFAGNVTGSPAQDWWDGCQWETGNIAVSGNTITNQPGVIPGCNNTAWPSCGANGIFSNYVNPIAGAPAWAVGSMITFWRGNTWTGNTYFGPPNFYAWQQGNSVTPAQWTGALGQGDRCTSNSETVSARCAGPFGQDAGSQFLAAGSQGFFDFP